MMWTVFKLRAAAWFRTPWSWTSGLGLLHSIANYMPAVWRRLSDVSTLDSIRGWAGVDMPMLVLVVSNPFFGLTLIFMGLFGIPSVDRGIILVKKSKVWNVLGWFLLVTSFCAVVATTMFTQFLSQVGIAKMGQFYVDQHSDRVLSGKQIKQLENDICPVVSEWQTVAVFSVAGAEPMQYATQFLNIFSECHFNIVNKRIPGSDQYFPIEALENDTLNKGLLVSVLDKEHPDKHSIMLFDILGKYNLNPKYSQSHFTDINTLGLYVSEK